MKGSSKQTHQLAPLQLRGRLTNLHFLMACLSLPCCPAHHRDQSGFARSWIPHLITCRVSCGDTIRHPLVVPPSWHDVKTPLVKSKFSESLALSPSPQNIAVFTAFLGYFPILFTPSAQELTLPLKGIFCDGISSWKQDLIPLSEREKEHTSLHLMNSFNKYIFGYMFMLLEVCLPSGQGEKNFHWCKVWCFLLSWSVKLMSCL